MQQFINHFMTTSGLSGKTSIYVSTLSQLNAGQRDNITHELLRIMGYPANYDGFNIHFVNEGNEVQANAYVNSDFKVSIGS